METLTAPPRRAVHSLVLDTKDAAAVSNAIEDMYQDKLDVLVVRNALPGPALQEVGRALDRDDSNRSWARPNEKMPVEDIQLLGTDTPATPTYQSPRGATLEAYLDSAARNRAALEGVFDSAFNPAEEVRSMLARFAGGRPVEVATASDGRTYVPATVRRLIAGKQIGIHHDYHYRLALYQELSQQVDIGTLVSYVVTLQAPEAGGELYVYGVTPDTPGAPKMPNGFSWDLEAIEKQYDSAKFKVGSGDLFLLASGRCLHRVGLVSGPRARVTMGGFLALDSARQRVLFWS